MSKSQGAGSARPPRKERMKNNRKNIQFVKDFAPGYIGGQEITKIATDNEIGYLIDLNNQIAEHYNTLIDLREQEKNILNSIKKRNQ